MEKIILFLIVFGIASLFEYLKKMREKRADSPRAARPRHQRPVNFDGFGPFSRLNAQYTSTTFPSVIPDASPEEGPVTAPEQRPSLRGNKEEKAARKSFLPGENLPSISETEPLEVATPDEITAPLPGPRQEPVSPDDHYRRWRQAIIDSEILRPKFADR